MFVSHIAESVIKIETYKIVAHVTKKKYHCNSYIPTVISNIVDVDYSELLEDSAYILHRNI